MKKNLIIFIVIVVIAIIGIVLLNIHNSQKPVIIRLEDKGYSVVIKDSEKNEITTLNSTTTLQLAEGEYTYAIKNPEYDQNEKGFTVKGDETTVTITPRLSLQRLSELLDAESLSIQNVLYERYNNISFTISDISLYKKGEWAAGMLTPSVDPRELPDKYRFVLYKKSGVWDIVISPSIAIDKNQFKNVPADILYNLYSEG